MHANRFSIFVSICIKFISVMTAVPFMFGEPVIIVGVNDCELALR